MAANSSRNKIYFASDFHLGVPDEHESRQREARIINWLTMAEKDAAEIFLIGDLFDFWHEYDTVIPKGFVRLQARIASLTDAGIPVHIFTGNHDLWMYGYFEKELGAKVYKEPIDRTFHGRKFHIGHGDGLGPGDHGYKFLKKVFTNPLCQWLFKWIHPDLGTRMASFFSYRSRYSNGHHRLEEFKGKENEWLVSYCESCLDREPYDYFIFGHRHLPLDIPIREKSRYINTGDWLDYNSYAVFDGETLQLLYFGKD